MGNLLETCGHLLNDVYPHILLYLSPRDILSVSLVSRWSFQLVTDREVWKELWRRDFSERTRQLCIEGVTDTPYKSLYRACANRVLLIYHVFREDGGEKSIEHILQRQGIKVYSLVCSSAQANDGQVARLREELEEELPKWPVVMCVSNGGVSAAIRRMIGDALSYYVEGGGAVVLFQFASSTEQLLGRWAEQGYSPMLSSAQRAIPTSLVPTSPNKSHPLLKDVKKLEVTYHAIGGVSNSATPIAYYADGNLFAAELKIYTGIVFCINLFPPPILEKRDGGWLPHEDNNVPLVLRNAVHSSLKKRSVC